MNGGILYMGDVENWRVFLSGCMFCGYVVCCMLYAVVRVGMSGEREGEEEDSAENLHIKLNLTTSLPDYIHHHHNKTRQETMADILTQLQTCLDQVPLPVKQKERQTQKANKPS